VKIAIVVVKAGLRAEGAAALLATVGMLVFLGLHERLAILECTTTARRHCVHSGG